MSSPIWAESQSGRKTSAKALKYVGADWFRGEYVKFSPLGESVANILGQVWAGLYNLDPEVRHKRCKWNDENTIEIVVGGPLSTFDSGKLTTLVFLCHEQSIRLEISGASSGYLRLRFHRRGRDGMVSQRHPTMEQHLEILAPLAEGIAGGEVMA
jgi:hypothetical protein